MNQTTETCKLTTNQLTGEIHDFKGWGWMILEKKNNLETAQV